MKLWDEREQEAQRKKMEREANIILTILGLLVLYGLAWWVGR